jgi:hypothetical protein
MRILTIGLIVLAGCATGGPGEPIGATRTSIADIGGRGAAIPNVIHVQAGAVRVVHSLRGGARLRATTLEGLDETNRHLTYEWTIDGEFTVEVSGRYRHSVTGSVLGSGRLTSTLIYTPQPDDPRLAPAIVLGKNAHPRPVRSRQ